MNVQVFWLRSCLLWLSGRWLASCSPAGQMSRRCSFSLFVVSCLLSEGWKNRFPIVFHADYGPAFRDRFVPRFVESAYIRFAVVGPFAFSIIVVDDEHEARIRPAHRPLEHLLVAVGIPKCRDRSPTNENLNTDWLALFVIDELHFGQSQKQRLSISDFVFHFAAATNDLLWRNAVRLFGKATHKLDPAARYDESLEIICPQIREQLEHRLVNHL